MLMMPLTAVAVFARRASTCGYGACPLGTGDLSRPCRVRIFSVPFPFAFLHLSDCSHLPALFCLIHCG
ncbi:hypothetical protein HBH56_152550 [Parastagonospora nodorum]|uniref:Secreted protein n=1 Tax=Phaeosphaeria nodorum (strain SN15 / ATCC MYA-4574 / FGSC 10173) TaxID=321614 RepID=A0A7U2EZR4_PHANO|nr:hypothetical protein HBH56_152550 [Parastagonospora nodorum]QRC96083.1 hypothetical protein JI435_408280 [Parastagonospora nodorum SN15]KAH3926638.1 hypothetical protein HBH54_165130 [Parastagonospora nodorum]KAH3940351.1 hypothetical protein HBH53_218070 [Parastagonospora nodorum]KAH3972165.1 hypothetical protein HBH51_107440 [Parastagonospora nodorum]